MNVISQLTKTGAVVCVKSDKENMLAYEALLFVTGIPEEVTDSELKKLVDNNKIDISQGNCSELIFRADIHATSNEVQEQYEHLHTGEREVPRINYASLILNNFV